MKSRTSETPEQLLENLRALLAEAEKTITESAGDYAGDKLSDLHQRLDDARARIEEIYEKTRRRVVAGAKRTDEAIRTHPYESLAIALGVGVLLGAVLRRGN
jgi:ElaB/YqjD/DUF883 family membrane-anchored ribosome-binding protein